MKTHPFRHLVLPGLLLFAALSASAQVTNRPGAKTYGPGVKPAITKPATPAIVKPATPAITRPATPAITRPATPAITRPATPAIITPATPLPPGTVLPPGTIVISPPPSGVIPVPGYFPPGVGGYPSAWIGPTIIRETRSEPAPDPSSDLNTPVVPVPTTPLRLVAVLGSLQHLDAAGADLGLAEAPLGVSVGMLVGYAEEKAVRASGDFFGSCWDGPNGFARTDDTKGGPFLDHPIMTVNEMSPGPWELEAGVANRRISWMRLAVTLFEDRAQNPQGKTVNLPRGRRAAMREVLHRVTWVDKGVAAKTSGVTEAVAVSGGDVTHFGKALATFAEQTMTPTPDNERVGIAEWFFAAQDLGKIIAACPRSLTDIPDGAKLRAARETTGNTTPPWVRAFEVRNASGARYAGELWFIVVPDAAVAQWVQRK